MIDLRALGTQHELETSYGPVRYRSVGEGPPVVFLHGILANGALWRDVVPALGAQVRCITPDWPLGSHEAPLRPDADMSLPALARLVEEVFERLDLEDVTLVANDTGGAIAQWVAVHDPRRLGRLVLTPCDAFENFLPLWLRHLQLAGRTPAGLALAGQLLRFRLVHRLPLAFGALTVRPIDLDAMAAYIAPLRERPGTRRDFARLVRAISNRYTREAAERLGSFDKPALVVWSGQDRLFPLRHGHELARRLPQGRLEVVHDAGAFIPEDRPRELARLIDAFLAEQATAAPELVT
jgi:pimeloyl-ACP methyl ester carboxylesterase